MSGDLIKRGIIQFENPPINRGIIKKKIIKKAWEVINLLKIVEDNILPQKDNSIRINILIDRPKSPAQIPNRKYNEPMSLWLVDIAHRMIIYTRLPVCKVLKVQKIRKVGWKLLLILKLEWLIRPLKKKWKLL